MSSPNSSVDICNLALDHLKQAPATNIDTPNTPTEVICARWYDSSRRDLLRQHPWNFATKRAQLAPNSTSPDFGYNKAFDVPADFVRLLTIGDDAFNGFQVDRLTSLYQFEQNQILSNADEDVLKLRYIFDMTNVTKFDSSFIELLALKLASSMSYQFAGTVTVRANLKNEFAEKLLDVTSTDGQERPPIRIQRSAFITARSRRGSTNSLLGNKFVVFN